MANWEFIVHDSNPSQVFPYVTARCSDCKYPLWMNPRDWMGVCDDGVQIFKACIINYNTYTGRMFMLNTAKYNSDGRLPKYCCNCGKRIQGVEYGT